MFPCTFIPPTSTFFAHGPFQRHVHNSVCSKPSSAFSKARSTLVKRKRVRCKLDDHPEEQPDEQTEEQQHELEVTDENNDDNVQIKRQLSAESRAKISAALKGRRKSESHRESLSKRLSGEQNPMYGRKVSAETRAKISQSLTARRRKKHGQSQTQPKPSEQPQPQQTDKNNEISEEENIKIWKTVVEKSKLLKSVKQSEEDKRYGRKPRKGTEDLLDEDIDKVLRRVAKLDSPPENVARLIHNTQAGNKNQNNKDTENVDESNLELDINNVSVKFKPETRGRRKMKKKIDPRKKLIQKCTECKSSGFVDCPTCVIGIGVISSKCPTCYGAGAIFCSKCDGAGSIRLSPNESSDSN